MTQTAGGMWLPYGSDDPSVIFRHPLTVAFPTNPSTGLPAGAICPYTTRSIQGDSLGPYYDPKLGVRGSIEGNTATGSSVRLSGGISATQLAALRRGGQYSFEVRAGWAAENGTVAIGSVGTNPTLTSCAIHFRSVASATGEGTFYKQNTGELNCIIAGAIMRRGSFISGIRNANCTQSFFHSYGKEEMIRINVGWTGSRPGSMTWVAIDDALLHCDVMTLDAGNMFERIEFGGLDGALFAHTGNIRNLQISSRLPKFEINKKLRHVAIMSDSMIASTAFFAHIYRDLAPEAQIRRTLEKSNVMLGKLSISNNSGYGVAFAGAINFLSSGAAAVTRNTQAEVVCMYAGTNDRFASTEAHRQTFKTEYRTLIEFFLGSKCTEGAYVADTTSCKVVVCCTTGTCVVPTYTQAEQNGLGLVSGWIREVVAEWDANYPSAAGRVVLSDIRAATGGTNDPATWPEGSAWFSDGLHMSWPGYYWLGKTIGETLRDKVLTSNLA